MRDVPAVVWLHLATAIFALAVGVWQLAAAKGTAGHRRRGRVWLALMYVVAGSSLFIQALRPGHFTWIHGLALWTLIAITIGLVAIRRGNTRRHAGFMIGTLIGALIAGAFAIAGSDRLLHVLLF
jgi:uncharacterized membrane protein